MNWFSVLSCWCVCWITNRVHLLDGQADVKTLLLHEMWLRSGELYSSGCSDVSRYVRNVSRIRKTTSTGAVLSGEDFKNRGTFIVVRSSVFVLSSTHSSPLARDAYNALWDSRRRSQERKYSPDSHSVHRSDWVWGNRKWIRRQFPCLYPFTLIYLILRFATFKKPPGQFLLELCCIRVCDCNMRGDHL